MGNYDWTMGMSFGELQVEYRWRDFELNGISMGYSGSVIEVGSEREIIDRMLPSEWIGSALRSAAREFRISQLQHELHEELTGLSFLTDMSYRREIVLHLFRRAEAGEYMAQGSNQRWLYVQDVAEILMLDMATTLELIGGLEDEGQLGLDGFILITAEAKARRLAEAERVTGHRELAEDESGDWSCAACGQCGDEDTQPGELPCEPRPSER